MHRFRFRLAPLLRLRAQLERVARRELARTTAELQAVEQQLLLAARARQEFAEQASRGGAGGRLARALAAGLARREGRLAVRQRKAAVALEAARADYLGRARELGTMQKLEERQRDVWQRQAWRQEQQELDEVARLGREARRIVDEVAGETR
jgi:flagellar export protein FliJ